MLTRSIHALYEAECRMFTIINRHFDKKLWNLYFRTITQLGGAVCTISTAVLLLLVSEGGFHHTALAAALSLTISHIPVQILKKLYPRKRPYLMLAGTKHHHNPLQDHSFPSGHTTAVFSIIIALSCYNPTLLYILLPVACSVGLSRMYLGLHYPSDVLAGMCLGTCSALLSYHWIAPHLV